MSRQDTRGRLGEIRTYDRRQILQSAVRNTTPGPRTAPPGRPLFAPRSGLRRGTIRNPPRRGRLGPSWHGLGPSGEGRRVGGRDRRGQRWTAGDLDLLPAWVGHPPGSLVGLWAGDRPPSAQVRTIIPPQVHRPGQSGNPPLRQAGSRLLVNPDIIHVERDRRRRQTIGGTTPIVGTTDIKVEHQVHRSSRDARRPSGRLDIIDVVRQPAWLPLHLKQMIAGRPIRTLRKSLI